MNIGVFMVIGIAIWETLPFLHSLLLKLGNLGNKDEKHE